MSYKAALSAILIILVLVFLVQNTEVVKVNFLLWDISMSRAVLLFFSMLIGFVFGWFLHSYLLYRKKKNKPEKY
ncbi:MAG: hypothetical protein APR62_05425 [Smithella sp. SDB]|nr:MAG: hypothetical protein APR62_05425 [Smithella sp. SDB]